MAEPARMIEREPPWQKFVCEFTQSGICVALCAEACLCNLSVVPMTPAIPYGHGEQACNCEPGHCAGSCSPAKQALEWWRGRPDVAPARS